MSRDIVCPTCRTTISLDDHPGLGINRVAYINSQLLTLREMVSRARPIAMTMRKDSEAARTTLASCEAQIAALTSELHTLTTDALPVYSGPSDPMAGLRFDGNDRPEDERICFGGPCPCGAPEGLRHRHTLG